VHWLKRDGIESMRRRYRWNLIGSGNWKKTRSIEAIVMGQQKRPCAGIVQMDDLHYDYFEERGRRCNHRGYIGDATRYLLEDL
jgi:Txe/YoeB family toxin of Txe-Axe toxin-antitoxin module